MREQQSRSREVIDRDAQELMEKRAVRRILLARGGNRDGLEAGEMVKLGKSWGGRGSWLEQEKAPAEAGAGSLVLVG